MLRDYLLKDVQEIIVDNKKLLNVIHKYIFLLNRADFKNKIKLYQGKQSLFQYYDVEYQVNVVFQRSIKLASGGKIIIDTTEALTVIDVNSCSSTQGQSLEETALNTNLEAINEICRQLKLRDIGGLIIIDFIDMSFLKNKKIIELYLHKLLKKDRARVKIGSISRFGLLEMSRQSLGHFSNKVNYNVCSKCKNLMS